MKMFNSPGNADALSDSLLTKWNEEIVKQYNGLKSLWSEFFKLNPKDIPSAIVVNSVKWFGDPAEPTFCQNVEIARKLSDWDLKGRHNLHNEYCEYAVEYQMDSTGRRRPKRVQVTTELREYWLTLAKFDPDFTRQLASSVLGRDVTWIELYGTDPHGLDETQRETAFSTQVAGDGNNSQPVGKLNTENALFMSHPINGLDDLLYIVMFGAKPYARKRGNGFEKINKEALFRRFDVERLGCRHADPAAAMAAYDVVYQGRNISFSEDFGMYIRSFTKDSYSYNGAAIPDSWIKFSRGQNKLYQRFVFGPLDNEEIFLDNITVERGGVDVPVSGGFDIVQNIEVGPIMRIGEPRPLNESDYVLIEASGAPFNCSQSDACETVAKLLDEYNNSRLLVKTGPRTMSPLS